MTQDEVLNEFRAAGALLEGHFILSSGLHSNRYLQCARVLMDPQRAARLCAVLAEQVPENDGVDACGAVHGGDSLGKSAFLTSHC